jgi:hypothetical protein
VQPRASVEHLDVINDVVLGFLTRGVISVRRSLLRSTAKEPLGHRMVETLSLAAHTTANPLGSPHALRRVTGLLPAAIRVMQQPS